MPIKVYLEKAYDIVKWDFVEVVVRRISFSKSLIKLIISYIQLIELYILWNEESWKKLNQWGVWNKGILFPLISSSFCIEILGKRIEKAISEKRWKGFKASRSGQIVSHIFFVDDLFLFGEASMDHASLMAKIMQEFCDIGGQKVNPHESRLYVSKNTHMLWQPLRLPVLIYL